MTKGKDETTMDRNETLADLAEAVRKMARDMEENADWENDVIVVDHTLVEGFTNLADRIEAAAKRETVAGDAAKLREALESLIDIAEEDCIVRKLELGDLDITVEKRRRILANAKDALAATPRNCDVGTVKEQVERLCKFCEPHVQGACLACTNCKLKDADICELEWAQMPYEAGGQP